MEGYPMEDRREVTGMVTRVDTEARSVRLKQDSESLCTLSCGVETQVHGEEAALALERLQAGDYIKSECTVADDGRLLASKIILLRPAWRILESPES
jgi:hypothetical protein